jgi:hypothetical protein
MSTIGPSPIAHVGGGLSPASLLDDSGHAAKWRKATISMVERGYASYLHWLERARPVSGETR